VPTGAHIRQEYILKLCKICKLQGSMIQIKRNSSEFKKVKDIFSGLTDKQKRKKSIKLFALRPYEDLSDRIFIRSAIIYDITYETILDYLLFNKSKKLFRNEGLDLYYFKSSAASKWIEFPFEFVNKKKKRPSVLRVLK
jgi:hypothetical protein